LNFFEFFTRVTSYLVNVEFRLTFEFLTGMLISLQSYDQLGRTQQVNKIFKSKPSLFM